MVMYKKRSKHIQWMNNVKSSLWPIEFTNAVLAYACAGGGESLVAWIHQTGVTTQQTGVFELSFGGAIPNLQTELTSTIAIGY